MRFWTQMVSKSNVFSAALFHGQSRRDLAPASPASTLWFIKVACTLCIHHSHSLTAFNTDYFRQNLTPFVAFAVVSHVNNRLNNPNLAFSFCSYTRFSLNLVHTVSTFDLLLKSLCQVGLHDSAELLYQYMKADGLLPSSSILDFVVLSFANTGKFGVSEEILIARAEMCTETGEIISPFVYNNFLSILVGRNMVDRAVLFFKGHILRLRSFSPDTCSFNIVMRGLCRVGKVETAFEFFDVMRSFGCCPDLVSYNTLINGLCKVGKVDRAHELLRGVHVECGFSPDVVTYTSVISGYCKSGKMEDAASLLDEMIGIGIGPNLFTFNVIVDGFGKTGKVDSALEVYERMVRGGLHPDVVTFTSLIDGHCRLGQLEQGLKLWDEMKDRKVSPNLFSFSVLISALCKENRLNEARDLLRQLNLREDIVPRPFIYNPVIDGFCKSGNVDEANAIVAEMDAKGCVHDKMTFTILILGHCMKGRMFEAIEIYNKMLSVGCSPDNITTRSLISCLRKAGMAREANEIDRNASNAVHTGSSSSKQIKQFRNKMSIHVAV